MMQNGAILPNGRHTDRRVWLAWLLCACAGVGAGLLNGLLGAAGGILLVTVLPHLTLPAPLLARRDMTADKTGRRPRLRPRLRPERRDTFALALTVMLPVSAISLWRYISGGLLPDGAQLWWLILPAAAGGLLGAWLLDRLSPKKLRLLFALLIMVSGLRMMF